MVLHILGNHGDGGILGGIDDARGETEEDGGLQVRGRSSQLVGTGISGSEATGTLVGVTLQGCHLVVLGSETALVVAGELAQTGIELVDLALCLGKLGLQSSRLAPRGLLAEVIGETDGDGEVAVG